MLSDFWDKYKFHPGLVESGLKGFPMLEPGKFYTFPLQNYERSSLGSGHTVWECSGKPNYHGEYAVSYPLLHIGPHDGVILETFIYGWFNRGHNIVLELPEEQQTIMRTLKASIGKFSHINLPSDHTLKGYRNAVQSKPGGSL